MALRVPFKKLLAAAIVAAFAASPAAAQKKDGPKKDEPQINAPHAILIDVENGGVLYERDPDKLIFPASLAKLMTAEYMFHEIKEGRVKLTDEYVVSENAWRKGGAPSHGSTMFAAKLTERARQIGLAKSTFANSNGLPDPGTQVTTRELGILARHIILTYPDFYKLFGQTDFTWNKIRQPNRNPLLAMSIGADGLKTGFTKEAGYGLVGSAVQNGLRLIVVVNGLKSEKERADEAKKLLEWGFHSFQSGLLFADGQEIAQAKLYGGNKGHVPLVAGKEVRLMVPRGSREKVIARVVYTGPVPAPVQQGQKIGTLKVWRGESLVLEVPLRAAESIGTGSMSQRAFDAASELVVGLFRAGLQRL